LFTIENAPSRLFPLWLMLLIVRVVTIVGATYPHRGRGWGKWKGTWRVVHIIFM